LIMYLIMGLVMYLVAPRNVLTAAISPLLVKG